MISITKCYVWFTILTCIFMLLWCPMQRSMNEYWYFICYCCYYYDTKGQKLSESAACENYSQMEKYKRVCPMTDKQFCLKDSINSALLMATSSSIRDSMIRFKSIANSVCVILAGVTHSVGYCPIDMVLILSYKKHSTCIAPCMVLQTTLKHSGMDHTV